jgi:hypothetical protein
VNKPNRGVRALIPTAHARSVGDATMVLPRIPATEDTAPASTPGQTPTPAIVTDDQDHASRSASVVPLGTGRRTEPTGPVELDRSILTSAAAVLADVASGQHTAPMQRLADTLSDVLYAAAGTDTRRHAARTS